MIYNICKVMENVPLSRYSSMKTGGNARVVYFPRNSAELSELSVRFAANHNKYIVFGNMSNVLVPDEGMEIPVVITSEMKDIKLLSENESGALVYADCGVSYTKLALDCCKTGLSGLEFAYGIPGTVGGAVIMNAGAYGGETSDVIERVCAVDNSGRNCEFTASECEFSYRKSVFSDGKYVVTGAVFRLAKSNADECVKAAKELMVRRIDKQPLEYPSCGSTFKRPEGNYAGALIEKSFLKGVSVGGAQVSQKHAGFVINKGGATTEQVLDLMRLVSEKVLNDSNVLLEPEIRIYGKNGELNSL